MKMSKPVSKASFNSRLNLRKSSDGVSLLIAVAAITMGIIIVLLQLLVARPSQIGMYQKAQNSTFARSVALSAMARARDQMQTLLDGGTSLPVGYNWTGNISTPDNPNNLSGSSTIIGTYTASVVKKTGNFYLLGVTATVSGVQETVYKLIEVISAAQQYILDKVPGAMAAYGLRKLRSAYTGYAVQVKAVDAYGAVTGSAVDIGFDANGNLDATALKTALSLDTSPPLDIVSGAAFAYGMRKLRAAYSGPCLQVRRTSDNTTQDIGFDVNGDLDTTALTTFVGAANDGYVSIWYDQSGNNRHLTTASNNNQPLIFDHNLTGATKVIIQNNRPAIYFDAVSRSSAYQRLLYSTGTSINSTTLSAYMVGRLIKGGAVGATMVSAQYNSDSNDWNSLTSSEILARNDDGAVTDYGIWMNNAVITSNIGWESVLVNNPNNMSYLFQGTSIFTGSQDQFSLNGGSKATMSANANLKINKLAVGHQAIGYDSLTCWLGHVSEIIMYTANHSTANQASIKKNQFNYYQVYNAPIGRITKWYDQSGNGKDLTSTGSKNPKILLAPKPAIAFTDCCGGEDNHLANTSVSLGGTQVTALVVAMMSEAVTGSERLLAMVPSGGTNDSNVVTAFSLAEQSDSGFQPNAYTRYLRNGRGCGDQYNGVLTLGSNFQATMVYNGTTGPLRTNGALGSTTSYCGGTGASSGTFNSQEIHVGKSVTATQWAGTVSEVIIYNSNPGAYVTAESDQRTYFRTP